MNSLETIGTRVLPANYGPLRGFNAHARIAEDDGDTMEFWLELEDGRVRRASFTTDGSKTSVTCGSLTARFSQGQTPDDLKRVTPGAVLEALGQPDNGEARHCVNLALRTLTRALVNHGGTPKAGPNGCECPDEARGEPCAEQQPAMESRAGAQSIRKRILVLSGKGGVGKSTVAVNLAMGFAFKGLRAGLLDVDIHGPSVPKLLGMEGFTIQKEGRDLLPVELGGLKVMSMGFVLKPDEAAIWRGPMKAGMVQQFVKQVQWNDLDVLVVDCPPGTGDEHLSIIQALGRVDGAIIVTTPQELAILDARKAITFCRTAQVPIVGIVENMSGFHCPSCGTQTPIFQVDGGKRMAKELGIPFLGALPIDPEVGASGDSGYPQLYRELGFGAQGAFRSMFSRLLAFVAAPVK